MNFFISLIFLSFFSLAFTTPSMAAVGDASYISDVLNVPLRSGPSNSHRILHRGLPSGTQLTILAINEEAGFTQVRTSSGLEGWVTSQYLVGTPIARVKLASAEKRLQSLNSKLTQERDAHTSLQAAHKGTQAKNRELNSQVESLTKELTELKRISADPINEHTRNVELTQQNQRLVSEVEELSARARRLEENVQREWLVYGGALVLIGLLLGVIIKARPRQKTYSRYT